MNISKAEWEIMRIVWANEVVTSSQIITILEEKIGWSKSTVKTLISRLVEKGFLDVEKEKNKYIYRASECEDKIIFRVLKEDLLLICNKKIPSLITGLIEENEFNRKQIKTLISLLEKKMLTALDDIICNCSVGQCKCKKRGD